LSDDFGRDRLRILELLVEVPRQEHYGVFQLALAVLQRALAEFADHDHCTDADRRNQDAAAGDQPEDGVAALPECEPPPRGVGGF